MRCTCPEQSWKSTATSPQTIHELSVSWCMFGRERKQQASIGNCRRAGLGTSLVLRVQHHLYWDLRIIFQHQFKYGLFATRTSHTGPYGPFELDSRTCDQHFRTPFFPLRSWLNNVIAYKMIITFHDFWIDTNYFNVHQCRNVKMRCAWKLMPQKCCLIISGLAVNLATCIRWLWTCAHWHSNRFMSLWNTNLTSALAIQASVQQLQLP